ncbi:MAG: hypothetical protein SEPTF4163_005945, partial [Sporothrix epigloea]
MAKFDRKDWPRPEKVQNVSDALSSKIKRVKKPKKATTSTPAPAHLDASTELSSSDPIAHDSQLPTTTSSSPESLPHTPICAEAPSPPVRQQSDASSPLPAADKASRLAFGLGDETPFMALDATIPSSATKDGAATTSASSPPIVQGLRDPRHAVWCSSGSKRTYDESPSLSRQIRLVSASDANSTLMHSTSCYEERELVRNISAALARRDYDALVSAAVSFRDKMSPDLVAADLDRDYAFSSDMNKSPEVLTEGTKKQPKGQKKKEARRKARKAAAASVANVPEPATDVEMAGSDTPGPATAAKVGEKPASARQSPAATTGTSGVAATTPWRTAAEATAPRTAAASTAARAPATKSWASIAKSATTTAAAATPKAAWTVVTGKKTSATVTDTDNKILVLKGAKKLPDPRLLRNTINGSGMMHVVAARLSAKGNAVLT